MSRRRIKKPPGPRDGVERWRCPRCKNISTELVFDRPTDEVPVPPDPSFVCRKCKTVFNHKNGSILLGDRAARAALRVLEIQGKV
jgi:transposase-like protein